MGTGSTGLCRVIGSLIRGDDDYALGTNETVFA
jgi:hypothetical protein